MSGWNTVWISSSNLPGWKKPNNAQCGMRESTGSRTSQPGCARKNFKKRKRKENVKHNTSSSRGCHIVAATIISDKAHIVPGRKMRTAPGPPVWSIFSRSAVIKPTGMEPSSASTSRTEAAVRALNPFASKASYVNDDTAMVAWDEPEAEGGSGAPAPAPAPAPAGEDIADRRDPFALPS